MDKLKRMYGKNGRMENVRMEKYMVKNTEFLNTTNCCVFKCSNASNATTAFNSQRCFKSMFKIIHFLKITEDKKVFRECLK